MARARMIKPQFLRSNSMRRVSRDAQLTFIRLWLVADDAGRLHEGVHGLGFTLYPGDEDAQRRAPEWLGELEREHCIERYTVDRLNYMRIVNWKRHQRISHPTPSRIPARPVSRASHEAAGAGHEALASEAQKSRAGNGLSTVPANSGAIHEPREWLVKTADKSRLAGLLGWFRSDS